jgi:hypothetical protein
MFAERPVECAPADANFRTDVRDRHCVTCVVANVGHGPLQDSRPIVAASRRRDRHVDKQHRHLLGQLSLMPLPIKIRFRICVRKRRSRKFYQALKLLLRCRRRCSNIGSTRQLRHEVLISKPFSGGSDDRFGQGNRADGKSPRRVAFELVAPVKTQHRLRFYDFAAPLHTLQVVVANGESAHADWCAARLRNNSFETTLCDMQVVSDNLCQLSLKAAAGNLAELHIPAARSLVELIEVAKSCLEKNWRVFDVIGFYDNLLYQQSDTERILVRAGNTDGYR